MSYFGGATRFAGDPGFFGTLGRVLGGAAKIGGGFLLGGPAGAIAAGTTILGGGTPRQMGGNVFVPPTSGQITTGQAVKIGALAGGAAGGYLASRGQGAVVGTASGCPKGYQPAKVYVRGMGYQRVGHCVKVRRRNPYNRAAASRAASRLSSLGRGMKQIKKSVKSAARELS